MSREILEFSNSIDERFDFEGPTNKLIHFLLNLFN